MEWQGVGGGGKKVKNMIKCEKIKIFYGVGMGNGYRWELGWGWGLELGCIQRGGAFTFLVFYSVFLMTGIQAFIKQFAKYNS